MPAPAPPAGSPAAGGRALFVGTITAGSFLLFLVEPMVARLALPRLGGAAAVWNSALLVYQLLLLAGYAYAHRLSRLRPRAQAIAHGGVLLVAALWLPIGVAARELPPGAEPALWVPWLLCLSIGPLFFAVAAQAPLLARWYALARAGRDPYPLYAAANLGSFAGLVAYPLAAEPLLALSHQRWWWSGGYLLLAFLTLACAAQLPRGGRGGDGGEGAPASPPPGRAAVARWVALAAVPSGLMLATSTFLTTDVVALPLLWVLPLGLYLLSFSVAFAARRGPADAVAALAPVILLVFGASSLGEDQPPAAVAAGIALLLLFVAATALHTRLYRCRPAPDRLTGFYVAVAAGGAAGGAFAALVAPVLFDWTWEYPLLVVAAGALAPLATPAAGLWHGRRAAGRAVVVAALAAVLALRIAGVPGFADGEQGLPFAVVAALGLASLGDRRAFVAVLVGAGAIFGGWRSAELSLAPGVRARSYYGTYEVRTQAGRRALVSGTTIHGVELTGSRERERAATSYYVAGSGIGQAMAALPALYGAHARVGVVGLGAGTLACWARPGERWRFYEIDPVVVRIARTRFRFLADCLPDAPLVVGDARLALARERDASLDLLALDAFSSDAIPVHLMTREAFDTYARVLAPGGLLLLHVSNRFVDLDPVVAGAARAGGWGALVLRYLPAPGEEASPSEWIALSRSPRALRLLAARDAEWARLPDAGRPPWTDDRASLLPLLRRD